MAAIIAGQAPAARAPRGDYLTEKLLSEIQNHRRSVHVHAKEAPCYSTLPRQVRLHVLQCQSLPRYVEKDFIEQPAFACWRLVAWHFWCSSYVLADVQLLLGQVNLPPWAEQQQRALLIR